MKKKHLSYLTVSILLLLLGADFPYVNAADATQAAGNTLNQQVNAGVWLNQERQRQEQEKIAQRIAEGRTAGKVEGIEQQEQAQGGQGVSFVLQEIQMNKSSVLAESELHTAALPYIGKQVSARDLYALIDTINKLYTHKGYYTCKALLYPQAINKGIVRIELVEGKTGNVTVAGNKTTRTDYIRDRVHITEGKVTNIKQLDKDILRFAAANDNRLHVSLQAGVKEGTTDYTIHSFEPKLDTWGFFSDNLGNDSSGLYRGGLYWTRRSLTGRRDPLSLSTVFSKGMCGLTAAYAYPIGRSGTRLGLTYSTNRVRTIYGFMETLETVGHSRSITLALTQPVKTTETVKAEAGLEYEYQNSKTDTIVRPWLDNTVYSTKLYYDQINYGKGSVFYQKHSYQFGDYRDIYRAKNYFGKYMFNTFYQKRFDNGQALSVRLDGQFNSSNYIPSAEQFYIGGMYTVRGYKESLLSGHGGLCGSLEYEVPVLKHPNTRAYAFFDAGRIWGSADSTHTLGISGTGIGLKSSITPNIDVNVCLAFALTQMVNYEEQSKTRIHFSLNGRF